MKSNLKIKNIKFIAVRRFLVVWEQSTLLLKLVKNPCLEVIKFIRKENNALSNNIPKLRNRNTKLKKFY